MYTYNRKNDNMRGIPQLRVLVTSRCNSKCIYCRDGGETFSVNKDEELSADEIVKIVSKLTDFGMQSVKISGGEPMLRNDLRSIVKAIRHIEKVKYLELITRDYRVVDIIKELEQIGLDCINFSLDTLRTEKWNCINGKEGLEKLIECIREVSKYNIHLKINSVLIQESFEEIYEIIEFLESIGGGTLKLLDLIDDIVQSRDERCLDISKCIKISEVMDELDKRCLSSEIINAPGGLGHPMKRYVLPNNVDVVVKTSQAGAFYHYDCRKCSNFPCYDALMALRLTPDGNLQRCLLREDNLVNLRPYAKGNEDLDEEIRKVLSTYSQAEFYEKEQIDKIREDRN